MTDDDQIEALAAAREKLAVWSRETGVAKHGDLTRMDRQIGSMVETANRRKLADYQRQAAPERGGRDR